MSSASSTDRLPRASLIDTFRVVTGVLTPSLAKGVIIRRPWIVGMAETLGLDTGAVECVQSLHEKYGDGPLILRLPGRTRALVLSPRDAERILDGTDEPFAIASQEKAAALSHFQPEGVLISHGPERDDRRRYNEAVLDTKNALHQLSERFVTVVREEASDILNEARRDHEGKLIWQTFSDGWFRLVRRVVFGDGARDDEELTEVIEALRSRANWAGLFPKNKPLRQKFFDKINGHLKRAEPGSLAAIMANVHTTSTTEPTQQVPQWLFAYDPAGMATFRALALLASHPDAMTSAHQEIASGDVGSPRQLPYLRACVLESLRLWPTSPMILRESTQPVTWDHGVLPEESALLIFTPYFQRDDRVNPHANTFAPQTWPDGQPEGKFPLIPFSSGPGMCPGRNLVLLSTSTMLAALLEGRTVELVPPDRLDPSKPLPGTLDNYELTFRLVESRSS